jgi:Phospholipase_D-nuclease N-terminal
VYWGGLAIYVVLSALFIVDVLRQPESALSGVGKTLWVLALIFVPVLAWIVYGFWRIQRSRL